MYDREHKIRNLFWQREDLKISNLLKLVGKKAVKCLTTMQQSGNLSQKWLNMFLLFGLKNLNMQFCLILIFEIIIVNIL